MKPVDEAIRVYQKNFGALRVRAYSITRNIHDTEDVMQNVLISLLEKPDSVKHTGNLLGFLRLLVRNEAVDAVRKRGHTTMIGDGLLDGISDAEEESLFSRTECALTIQQVLGAETPELIDAFTKHVLYGYRVGELAKEMGILPNTLAQRFRRMKAKLREDCETGDSARERSNEMA